MALLKRSGPHLSLSDPSSLFWNWKRKRKLLPFPLLPHSISIIQTHSPLSPFSTLPEPSFKTLNGNLHLQKIIHSGIPSILKSLLEDSSSVKVGIGIAGDATKIDNDYNVSVQSLKDLSDLASRKLVGSTKNWTLSSLTETVIGKRLDKQKKIQTGKLGSFIKEATPICCY